MDHIKVAGLLTVLYTLGVTAYFAVSVDTGVACEVEEHLPAAELAKSDLASILCVGGTFMTMIFTRSLQSISN